MRWPHKQALLTVFLLAALGTGRLGAAPPAPAPSAPAPSAPAAIPNYGGRDSAPLVAGDEAAPNPVAQAGRALEALVLVLAGAAGVVYALKRFGLVQPGADGKPARIILSGLGRAPAASAGLADADVSVESSRTLPGGAMLHVVRVPGRTLLLAATPQSVTTVAEWADVHESTDGGGNAFEDFLARADAPGTNVAAANARLRSLLSRPKDTP